MARKRKKYSPSPEEREASMETYAALTAKPITMSRYDFETKPAMSDEEWEELVAKGKEIKAKARPDVTAVRLATPMPPPRPFTPPGMTPDGVREVIERIRGKLAGVTVEDKGWECNESCHCCEEVTKLKLELEKFVQGK